MLISRRGVLVAGLTAGAGLVADAVTGPGRAFAAPALPGLPALPPAPFIVNCPSWGARRPRSPVRIWDRRPIRILVHHTASANQRDTSRGAADGLARSIQRHHMDHNGWLDSGQHFTISRGGFVLEGRSLSLGVLNEARRQVEGAHCTGQNVVAIGIENEGTYIGEVPPAPLWGSLIALCAYVCGRYAINPTQIFGHRDYKNTICPGDRMYVMLPRLRIDVGAALGVRVSRTEASLAGWPLLRAGDCGAEVVAAQYLLRDVGAYRGDPTGRFDAATTEAVRTFQSATGAEDVNGLLGGESWPELARTLQRGRSESDAGRAVDALAAKRPTESVPDTVDARAWQRLLGTGGRPVPAVSDPSGVANR